MGPCPWCSFLSKSIPLTLHPSLPLTTFQLFLSSLFLFLSLTSILTFFLFHSALDSWRPSCSPVLDLPYGQAVLVPCRQVHSWVSLYGRKVVCSIKSQWVDFPRFFPYYVLLKEKIINFGWIIDSALFFLGYMFRDLLCCCVRILRKQVERLTLIAKRCRSNKGIYSNKA